MSRGEYQLPLAVYAASAWILLSAGLFLNPALGNEVSSLVKELVADAKKQVQSVTVDELATIMENDQEVTVVDIRTESEYEAGHLNSALWIPRGKLEFEAEKELPSTDAEIVVYCRVDGRSALAAATLRNLGYKRAKFLKGGFMEWAKAGHSVFTRHGELTVREFEKQEKE